MDLFNLVSKAGSALKRVSSNIVSRTADKAVSLVWGVATIIPNLLYKGLLKPCYNLIYDALVKPPINFISACLNFLWEKTCALCNGIRNYIVIPLVQFGTISAFTYEASSGFTNLQQARNFINTAANEFYNCSGEYWNLGSNKYANYSIDLVNKETLLLGAGATLIAYSLLTQNNKSLAEMLREDAEKNLARRYRKLGY